MGVGIVFGLQNSGKSRAIDAFVSRHGPPLRTVQFARMYELPMPFARDFTSHVVVMNSSRQERNCSTQDPDEMAQRFVESMRMYETVGADCALVSFSLVEDRGTLLIGLIEQPLRALIANEHRVRIVYIRRPSRAHTAEADLCFLRVSELRGLEGAEVVDNFEGRPADEPADLLESTIWRLAIPRMAITALGR